LRAADQHSQQLVSDANKHAGQLVALAKAQADQILTDTAIQVGRLQAAAQGELGVLTRQKESISSYLAPIRELLST